MSHEYPGKLILFEGCEGAGKSTLIIALGDTLRKREYNVVETKEPRGHARDILLNPDHFLTPKEELAIFIDGRAEHFSEIIIPALKRGDTVLCDRSTYSTIAYQHYGRGLDLTDILIRDAKARQNVNFDLIILLDINPEIGLRRKKPETRFELEAINFHHCVRNGYLEQAENDPDGRWVIIDASKSANEVFNEVLKTILKFLYDKNRGQG
ncbi:MAG: Thymidylate kinase [Candidatus Roizmanbacteria bacterium GW2011_GWC2_41_7]|uniref:Thymidylate kinase n=1 Tax=Candidatus Roizmanbacteria bacterium GW2011_GWC2_41_7 TaxID=1618487 RepID=A0A0G0ZA18_9BACT|nr:MAG: Thymidylate kinase [Candidatus Roizmanbacteria bacterium GW2011_GWC2_41_7]